MPTLPKTIFKYEGFSTLSLLNLKKQSVYFASPRQFNDPYDCAIKTSVADPTLEELQKVRKFYLSDPRVPSEAKSQLDSLQPLQLKIEFVKGAHQALDDNRDKFLSNNGVCCFTERNDDLLMWSHYGGRYEGFCLEFRTDYEPFNKIRKVRYVKEMPSVRIDSLLADKNSELIVDLYCTKSRAWAYEKEWRGFHIEAGKLYTYKTEALKAVYFGPDIDDQAREIVCLVLAGQNPDVEFWRGTRSETKFKVEFEKVTYTSYVDAKREGLV